MPVIGNKSLVSLVTLDWILFHTLRQREAFSAQSKYLFLFLKMFRCNWSSKDCFLKILKNNKGAKIPTVSLKMYAKTPPTQGEKWPFRLDWKHLAPWWDHARPVMVNNKNNFNLRAVTSEVSSRSYISERKSRG